MKASEFIKLALANNHQLSVPQLNAERANVKYVIGQSGFNFPAAELEAYMLAVFATTGLTWSIGENLLYLSLDDNGRIEIKLTYLGAADLALGSNEIIAYQAWAIREGDTVKVSDGKLPIVSVCGLSPNRGALLGGLASALLPSGEYVTFDMTNDEIMSVAANGSEVWQSVYVDEMVKKQVLWRLLNHVAIESFEGFYNTAIGQCEAYRPIKILTSPVKASKFIASGIIENSASRFDSLLD